MVRKSARNLSAEIQATSEETRLVAQANYIYWAIFTGKHRGKEYIGFNPDTWSADCVPYNTYMNFKAGKLSRETFEKETNVRNIKIEGVQIKQYYDPDKWVVRAPSSVTRQNYGVMVPVPQANRSHIGAVPRGGNPPTSASGQNLMQQRITALQGSVGGQQDVQYPGANDRWDGNVHQDGSSVSAYQDNDNKPMVRISSQSMEINSSSTKTAHKPDQNIHGNLQENFFAQVMPSSAAIPVKNHIPYLGEVVAGVAILTAIMSFFSQAKARGMDFLTTSNVINPTEVIDYGTMSRTYHQEY